MSFQIVIRNIIPNIDFINDISLIDEEMQRLDRMSNLLSREEERIQYLTLWSRLDHRLQEILSQYSYTTPDEGFTSQIE
jgi:hypothetical protein